MTDVLSRLLDAINLAVIATDLDGTVTFWSRGAEALYGWSAAESVGRPVLALTPANDSRDGALEIMERLRAGTGWSGTFAVRRNDGSQFQAHVTLSPLQDESGDVVGVIGVSEDVSSRQAEELDFEDRSERLRLALESGRMGTWRWDIASARISWDETLERVFGLAPGGYDGTFETYAALIHPDDRDATLGSIQHSLETHADHEVEHRIATADGTTRWVGGAGRVTVDAAGDPTGMIGVAADITARKAAEAERAELLAAEKRAHALAEVAGERLAVLADAGELLAQTLDFDRTLQLVADLVVDRLADWCTIDLVDDDDGSIRRAVVATSTDDAAGLAARLAEMHPHDPGSPGGVPRVIRTGEPALYADITDDLLRASARDDGHLELLRTLGMESIVIVPLAARGRTTGALSMVSSRPDRTYTADDVTLAGELARRAALALDNARLFAERAAIAATLQRSLLPPQLPPAAGLEIAASYRPGHRGLEIGGDFYDMFAIAPGTWCLVMGDVCGKDADAAALTGAVRWTVRAVAPREPDPRRIITVVNETLLAEESHHRFCTIIVAVACVVDGVVRLSVGNGGHPPPLLRRADGSVERGSEGGMLVGALPDIDVALDELELRPGDALVMYTDGVTEARRGRDLYGEQRLVDAVSAAAAGSASAIARAVESSVADYQTGVVRDDLALLVVRAPETGEAAAAATQTVALPRR